MMESQLQAQIQDGKVVHLKYLLKGTEGALLDEATSSDPFIYLHGAHQIVPGLENSLLGLKLGDQKKVIVQPEDGYGQFDPEMRKVVDRSQFPQGVQLKEGMQFDVDLENDESVVFIVESIEDEKVCVNGNHPLAGEVLHFDVEVLKIRDATQEEMLHGHAHEGCHSHHDEASE